MIKKYYLERYRIYAGTSHGIYAAYNLFFVMARLLNSSYRNITLVDRRYSIVALYLILEFGTKDHDA